MWERHERALGLPRDVGVEVPRRCGGPRGCGDSRMWGWGSLGVVEMRGCRDKEVSRGVGSGGGGGGIKEWGWVSPELWG